MDIWEAFPKAIELAPTHKAIDACLNDLYACENYMVGHAEVGNAANVRRAQMSERELQAELVALVCEALKDENLGETL